MTKADAVRIDELAKSAFHAATPRLAVKVNGSAAAAIRKGHPWLYADAITNDPLAKQNHTPILGQFAVVFDPKGRFCGVGLYDHDSPIRVRMLHAGHQRNVDDRFWFDRLNDAAQRRHEVPGAADGSTNAYRLINGEGDGFGGLVMDRYDDWIVAKVYSLDWLAHLDGLFRIIAEDRIFGFDPTGVIVRFARWLDRETLMSGTPPPLISINENGLRFAADLLHGQKTGMFLDQRDNRLRVKAMSNGKRVLDLFCCNGGFGVYAAAGGARIVHSVDSSAAAVESAKANLESNRSDAIDSTHHMTSVGDVFEVLDRMKARHTTFDLIVSDPPSFAHSAAMIPRAQRAYERLVSSCLDVLNPGGVLVQASCSSRIGPADLVAAVENGARTNHRPIRIDEVTGHGADHPVRHPEGVYLKAVFATAD